MPGPIHMPTTEEFASLMAEGAGPAVRDVCSKLRTLGGMLGNAYIRDPNWQPGPMAGPGKPWVGKAKKGRKR